MRNFLIRVLGVIGVAADVAIEAYVAAVETLRPEPRRDVAVDDVSDGELLQRAFSARAR